MEQQSITNGGLQYVPQIAAVQYVYLDFDGELTSYDGEILTIDNVEVQDSSLTEERIKNILTELNAKYTSQNVIFVTERPETAEYSTIYIGKTDAFAPYGSFAGLAETIDHGNENRSDNAFVMLDATATDIGIISTISHETDHLLGTLDHGGNGLAAYAARYDVSSGETSSGIVLSSYYDSMYVHSGGTATGTIVNSWGYLYVSSGGTAISTTVNDGNIYVSSGGTAIDTFVNTRGNLYVSSGGTAISTTVNDGNIYVSSGGTAIDTFVNTRGNLYVSSGGTATVAYSPFRGEVYSEEGATVTYLDPDAKVYYVDEDTGLLGKYDCIADIVLSDDNDGSIVVLSGGTAINISVNDDELQIFHGGVAYNTVVSEDGDLDVFSGGVASGVTISSDGKLTVYKGGSAVDVDWRPGNGEVSLRYGATVEFRSAFCGAYFTEEGRELFHHAAGANGVTINPDQELHVFSGGVTRDVVVNGDDALLQIYSGGSVCGVVVKNSGELNISRGGYASNVEIASGGELHVRLAKGTCAYGTSAGKEFEITDGVFQGNGIDVEYMRIEEGGKAYNLFCRELQVKEGGEIYNVSGDMSISSGAVAYDTVVAVAYQSDHDDFAYGEMSIESGGVAIRTTVNSDCHLNVFSGGVQRGRLQIENDASVSVEAGGIIDFTLSDRSVDDGYLINDLSLISGSPSYTVTVDTNQTNGTYKLAQGAASFNGVISIVTEVAAIGTIAVNGEDILCAGKTFSLDRSEGNLTLTVSGEFEINVKNLQSSADGLSWNGTAGSYVVEYSTDNFAHILSFETDGSAADSYGMPAGTYQCRVKAENDLQATSGNDIAVSQSSKAPRALVSDGDGNMDLFFANAQGEWTAGYAAQHTGILNGWGGANEQVTLAGKNKIADIFEGSTDANVLVMTDDANGDALFVDDIYTALGDQARLSQIDEIRAGAGDDIVDMTSQRYAYDGNDITVYGGSGNDTIWGGAGSNTLFGDAGNDRLVGASGNDILAGGSGNDSMHGGGGDDIFTFGGAWGNDTVEQLDSGTVTLWFETGSEDNWNAETLTYTDGENSVTVKGVSTVTLQFGSTDQLNVPGAFSGEASEKIFEDKNKGMLA